MNTIETIDKLSKKHTDIIEQIVNLWHQEVLFSWRWWFGVIISILAWLFWIKYHNKKSRYRLLTAGFFVIAISLILDSIGVQIGLWSYRYEVVPFIPAYLPYDLALMPVVIMSLIQFKPNYSLVKKAIAFGFLTALIGEPLIVFTDIYNPIKWRYLYSVPIYIMIYLIAHWLTTRTSFEEIRKPEESK